MMPRPFLLAVAPLLLFVDGCAGPETGVGLRAAQRFEQRLRPTQNGALHTYDPAAQLESHLSSGGRFKVWYVTTTGDAVPLSDADQSGVPDYVEEVADTFDAVFAYEVGTLGFRAPPDDTGVGAADDGGDDRFDVYLIDFAGAGDGAFGVDGCLPGGSRCAGHMTLENDFVGYHYPSLSRAVSILASHEFFHSIQAAYDSEQDTWWTESTATWAEEMYDPSQSDFEGFLDGYLSDTDRSIDTPPVGPVDSFSYGLAIWPKFLEERYGPELVRAIWENLEDGAGGVADPEPLGAIDRVLNASQGGSFADAFAEFATWNLYTGFFANPALGYAGGEAYPPVALQWSDRLPHSDQLRLFRASIQYFSGELDHREQVTVGFADAEPPEGVRVALVMEQGLNRRAPVWIEGLDGDTPTVVECAGHDRAIAVLVNTAQAGSSKKPTLCFGNPEEVSVCRFPAGLDAGQGVDSGEELPPPDCGCRGSGDGGTLPLVGVLGLWLGRRRR